MQYNFRTFTQSGGPETFDGGEIALDVFKIPVVELLATFPALAVGDTVLVRNKSGLRQYVPELCSIYTDSTVSAGAANVVVDANQGLLPPPVLNTLTTAATGGTIPAGNNFVVITAIGAAGETLASNELSVPTTGANSTITPSWSAVTGAVNYIYYRSSQSGKETKVVAVGNVLTYTDTGAIAPGTQTPPTVNTAVPATQILLPATSFAAGPVRTTAAIGAFSYALYNNTPDAGSAVALGITTLPTGTGNIIVQIATRPAQSS